jgi:transcriptional regulator GlxA family with amidase domain
MQIHILALDGVFDTGLATVADTFGTANELLRMQPDAALHFDVTLVGMQKKVRTALGLQVPVVPAKETGSPDWVVVPAIGSKMPAPLQDALKRPETGNAGKALRQWAAEGAGMAAACIGTFVLAESGLLNGHAATTTWWLAPLFRQRYPAVKLDESRMVVRSANLITAGATLGHIDMALTIIRQQSPELASLTSRYMVMDARPSQSSYVIADHLAHTDPLAEAFEQWARKRLDIGFSLDHAADALATSKRTLARRMHKALGKTPLSYFQDLRVERAVHLLKTTSNSIEQIAAAVGYADGVTLRTLLRRRLGLGVRELRERGDV